MSEGYDSFFKASENADASSLDLSQRIAAGDETAMKLVYEQHSDALRKFVSRWLAEPNEASDIVHDTMLEVWRNAARFQGRSSMKSWLFSIARNKAIDRNRKGARLSYTDKTVEVEDLEGNPEDVLHASRDRDAIKECIKSLSEPHQRVMHLVYFQDLTYAEISEIEACPVGTIKTRVLHAKKHLASLLAKRVNR